MVISADRQGFQVRLYAALLDVLIAAVAAFAATFVLGLGVGPRAGAFAGAFVVLAYSAIEAFHGASPGKMFLDVRVRLADGGQPPRNVLFLRCAIKSAPCIIRVLAVLIPWTLFGWFASLAGLAVVASCFFALRANRQALHDQLAGTAVFSSEEPKIAIPARRPDPIPQPRAVTPAETRAA